MGFFDLLRQAVIGSCQIEQNRPVPLIGVAVTLPKQVLGLRTVLDRAFQFLTHTRHQRVVQRTTRPFPKRKMTDSGPVSPE